MNVNKEELHGYYCEECEDWTYIENLEYPSNVHCAHCGFQSVAINSNDFKKIMWAEAQEKALKGAAE
ncbi:hypothetical protein [Bacillus velezensis]|uniref:hypothetical protein n=1 Tax=Bacillus velezensis TaxID=492670 RepID=UPI00083D11AE|nr:hypothetical protein [Bacillus velezensis]ODB74160.1 hypothetical protein A7310_18055 [Bacillus velezensis]